ncbi:MAG: HEAT repeat domain-containing protein [Ardenticatenaceae bacterium]
MEKAKLVALLERIGEGDESARDVLLDYINQQPEGIRVLAYEALRDGGEDTADQLILTLADDPDLVVRPSARSEPIPDEADLSEWHPIAQYAGQEWQARVGARTAPGELLQQLQSADRGARIQAARALGEYQDPATVAALVDAIRSGDRRIAAAAVESLQAIGGPAVLALIETLTASDEQVRWHAAKALSPSGDARAVPALLDALEDKNYGIRWLAAEGLARIGRPTIVPLLRRLAERKASAWLKQGAWHVLNKLDLTDDGERAHYRQLGGEIRRSSAGTLPSLTRRELKRLGEET